MSIARQINQKLNRMLQGAQAEMQAIGNEWGAHNQTVVSDWNGKPRFLATVDNSADGQIDLVMRVQGQHADKWVWTDNGTEPHEIRARNVPRLKFQEGYNARTLPVARFRQGNGRSFGAWRTPVKVDHPGTAAREFTKTYAEQNAQAIRRRILERMQRELRR